MKSKFHRTKCTVKLRKSVHNEKDFYLIVEAYPVFTENSNVPKREFIALNRIVTTPIWDKDRGTRAGNNQPKRNAEGIIQCRSESDKEACRFAHKYCQIKQAEFDNQALYPELYRQKKEADQKANTDFIQYLKDLIKRRSPSIGESANNQWNVMLRQIEDYANSKTLRFGDLTPQWLDGFRNYLMTKKSKNEKLLSANSQKLYLTHFKTALINAYRDEILTTDLSKKILPIKGEKSHRIHLETKELEQLAKTPCKNDVTRRACLFSALTGLRHSDIKKLTWGEIAGEKTKNLRIEFRQKKTKEISYLPISKQALELCGKRQNPDTHVFPKLLPAVHINPSIKTWVKKAGIKKHITFHCFRHTFATLQLSGGTDIYTVSKMLGHADVRTTQIYAEVVDKTKQKATKAIKLNIKK